VVHDGKSSPDTFPLWQNDALLLPMKTHVGGERLSRDFRRVDVLATDSKSGRIDISRTSCNSVDAKAPCSSD
jgi:hypothetical protein